MISRIGERHADPEASRHGEPAVWLSTFVLPTMPPRTTLLTSPRPSSRPGGVMTASNDSQPMRPFTQKPRSALPST